MIENYFIELRKKKKIYALLIQDNMITQHEGGKVEHIVDMDNMKREMYWILCLNLMRKGWYITKANNIPDFDISYLPEFNIRSIIDFVHNAPCILIPNQNVYLFDDNSQTTWETTSTHYSQVYSPRCIIDKLCSLPFKVQFCNDNMNNDIMYIPIEEEHYRFLVTKGYDVPPFYNNWNQAQISIEVNTDLWKTIRFFGHGDLDITSFLRIVNS